MDCMSSVHRRGKLRSLIALAVVMTVMTPPAEAFWGKYGSRREAERACQGWLDERRREIRDLDYASIRCIVERDTKQVMVIKTWLRGDVGKEAVLKRFRY